MNKRGAARAAICANESRRRFSSFCSSLERVNRSSLGMLELGFQLVSSPKTTRFHATTRGPFIWKKREKKEERESDKSKELSPLAGIPKNKYSALLWRRTARRARAFWHTDSYRFKRMLFPQLPHCETFNPRDESSHI